MNPVARIIGLWPSAEHYAADIGLKYPSYARVLKMRGRIPRRYWDVTLSAADRRGLAVTRAGLEAAHQVEKAEPVGKPSPTTSEVAA